MYTLSVFLHLIFVAFWLGGMLFTAAVLVPATRKKLANQRGLLFTELGTRFSRLTWIAFPMLILTGLGALYGRGHTTEVLLSAQFWNTPYGITLSYKLLLFAVVLIASAAHDFWMGPKAAELMKEDPEHPRTHNYRKLTSWVGRINLVIGLGILYFAVTLVRG